MILIKNIHKEFSQQQVLQGVNLEIPTGCIQALMGANGAGKSTLVKIISGLSIPSLGEIHIDNEKITVDSYRHRHKVGYVFEEPMYIEKFTAKEYLTFVAKMYELTKNTYKTRVEELLAFFELPGDSKKYIERYSKGTKSKVSLAAALIHNPRYLILDEPFDGVDFLAVQRVTRLLRSMAQKGCTILVTSHQYDTIAELCDSFALLKDGKIFFNQTLSELEEAARGPDGSPIAVKQYVEKLMGTDGTPNSLSWV